MGVCGGSRIFRVGLVVALATTVAYPHEDCSDPRPYLLRALDTANGSQSVSEALNRLRLPRGSRVGAVESHSLQHSQGALDPRILVRTPCSIFTFTLEHPTLELAVLHQRADPHIRESVGGGYGVLSREEGELLLEFPFPRSRRLSLEEVLNRRNPEYPENGRGLARLPDSRILHHDTHKCSGCHVDVATTKGSLGQKELEIYLGGLPRRVSAIVSPGGGDDSGTQYCIPEDLKLIFQCRCRPKPPLECAALRDPDNRGTRLSPAARKEACARLKVVLDLKPRPMGSYDPRRKRPFQGCLSGRK